jgi:nucleotide-binding universal stress UspA family protein
VGSTDPSAHPYVDRYGRPVRCYGAVVGGSLVLLCTDGSDRSVKALAAGVGVLGSGHRLAVVTVADIPDPTEVTGTGFAGGVVSPAEFDRETQAAIEAARAVVDGTMRALDLVDAETQVVSGEPGPAICALADELSAAAIVIGTRGRGGLKRAVLGSVSDHVVRHARCPVLVTRESGG